MSTQRIIGAILVAVGILALAWGGIFWTDRDTVVDAGPFEITTAKREGIAIPRILGAVSLIGGIVLLMVPERRRA